MSEKKVYTKKDGMGTSPAAGAPPAQAEKPATDTAKAQAAKPAVHTAGPDAAQPAPAKAASKVLADPPTLAQLEKELKKTRYRANFSQVLRNTLFSLIVVAAVSALIAVLVLPVLQIHGSSMTPTLAEGDVVVGLNVGDFRTGDIVAFYYNNNILIKRVIAAPGDWVSIDENGIVSINGTVIEEPYLTERALGICDLNFPYQVPDGRFFVMGDHRETSVDSRSSVMGCVSRDMVIGRVIMRVWPISDLTFIGRE